jgi:hypothetical protein
MIILKWIFKKLVAGDPDLIDLARYRDILSSCEGVDEISTSVKCRGMSWLSEELLASQG